MFVKVGRCSGNNAITNVTFDQVRGKVVSRRSHKFWELGVRGGIARLLIHGSKRKGGTQVARGSEGDWWTENSGEGRLEVWSQRIR